MIILCSIIFFLLGAFYFYAVYVDWVDNSNSKGV